MFGVRTRLGMCFLVLNPLFRSSLLCFYEPKCCASCKCNVVMPKVVCYRKVSFLPVIEGILIYTRIVIYVMVVLLMTCKSSLNAVDAIVSHKVSIVSNEERVQVSELMHFASSSVSMARCS
jgi:hypothetical protein